MFDERLAHGGDAFLAVAGAFGVGVPLGDEAPVEAAEGVDELLYGRLSNVL